MSHNITPASIRDALGYMQLWDTADAEAREELLRMGGVAMVDTIVLIFADVAEQHGKHLPTLAGRWRLTHEATADATDCDGLTTTDREDA
ncbi:hypothetical protein [Nesterenkonia suensis]